MLKFDFLLLFFFFLSRCLNFACDKVLNLVFLLPYATMQEIVFAYIYMMSSS